MSLPSGTYNDKYEKDMAIVRTSFQWTMLILFLVLLFTLPLFANIRGLLHLTITIAYWVVGALGIGILTGYCGQISIGHAAFVAIGAYTAAILSQDLGFPFWATLPFAGVTAGLAGILVGLPVFRVKGFYLILTTLAAQYIVSHLLVHLTSLTGGYMGLTVSFPKLGGIVLDSPRSYYYFVIPITCLMVFLARNITRTKVGRAFIAIRDNDLAAEVMGINLFHYKLLAFFIGCFFAGVGGALYTFYAITVSPDCFTLADSIWYLGILVIGGMGSITGIIFGVIFIKGFEYLIYLGAPALATAWPILSIQQVTSLLPICFGLVIILFLVFQPRGLNHWWETLKSTIRIWPFPY